MLGTEFSLFYLQQGLKLKLNKLLSTYLEMYKKTYPDINPCCLTQDPVVAVDLSEEIPGKLLPSASIKVILVSLAIYRRPIIPIIA